jgi:hypothetical protein
LVTNERIQTKELEPPHVELEYFQLVVFELVSNHLALGNIKRTYVLVHYYHDVPIEDNNVIVCNDQNDAFSEALIDVHILEAYNPKGHVYSQPHGHYQLK